MAAPASNPYGEVASDPERYQIRRQSGRPIVVVAPYCEDADVGDWDGTSVLLEEVADAIGA